MQRRAMSTGLLLMTATVLGTESTAMPGKVLLEDDFNRTEAGANWKAVVPSMKLTEGKLVISHTQPEHGAVCSTRLPMKDVIIEFDFQLGTARSINAVIDDKEYKGSHAGHLLRTVLTAKQVRLGDDREGVMKNGIFERRKDPATKAAADAEVVDRQKAFPVSISPEAWRRCQIEIVGDRLRVAVDGKPIGELCSPGIAHPTKNEFHFTVSGGEARIDNLRITEVKTK